MTMTTQTTRATARPPMPSWYSPVGKEAPAHPAAPAGYYSVRRDS